MPPAGAEGLAVPPDLLPDLVLWVTPDGRVVGGNAAAVEAFGPALDGARLGDLAVDPADRLARYLDRCAGTTAAVPGALCLRDRARGEMEFHCDGARMAADRPVVCLVCRPKAEALQSFVALNRKLEELAQEVTVRQQAEQRLQASLDEQQVLFRELHHRVKNNLQFLISLVNLHAGSIDDPQLKGHYRELVHRVFTMGLVHKQLYDRHELSRVNCRDLIEALCRSLASSYGRPEVRLTVDVDDASVDVGRAIPLGLIVNELLSNALKHAVPPGQAGDVRVELRALPGGLRRLVVADTGRGLDVPFPPRGKGSFGLQLVAALARQIGAEIDLRADQGTAFTLTFPARSADGQ